MFETIDGITRTPVESTNIKSIGYSALRQVLAVEFQSGDIFHYHPFPEEQHDQLCTSESLGKFYHRNIKGKYAAQKMTGPCPRCGSKEKGPIGAKCVACGKALYVYVDNRLPEPPADNLETTVEL